MTPLRESPLCKYTVILCLLHVPKYEVSIFKIKYFFLKKGFCYSNSLIAISLSAISFQLKE